jgi:hypothetical protein
MESFAVRLAAATLAVWLFAGIGCSNTPAQAKGAPASGVQEASAKFKEMDARLAKFGPNDPEVWKYATHDLQDSRIMPANFAALMLMEIADKDPKQKVKVLGLLENKAIQCDPNQKGNFLVTYLGVLSHPEGEFFLSHSKSGYAGEDGNQVMAVTNRVTRIDKDKEFSEQDKTLIRDQLASRDSLAVLESLSLLGHASQIREEDKKWALQQVDAQITKSSGPEKQFWKVVHESVDGQREK